MNAKTLDEHIEYHNKEAKTIRMMLRLRLY